MRKNCKNSVALWWSYKRSDDLIKVLNSFIVLSKQENHEQFQDHDPWGKFKECQLCTQQLIWMLKILTWHLRLESTDTWLEFVGYLLRLKHQWFVNGATLHDEIPFDLKPKIDMIKQPNMLKAKTNWVNVVFSVACPSLGHFQLIYLNAKIGEITGESL